MATNRENHTPLTQREGALSFAAAGTPLNAAPTERPVRPRTERLALALGNAQAASKQAAQTAPPGSCQQCLTLSFFFDGTGNNLDADAGTLQHSNVARLFQSHLLDDKVQGRFSYYVPGLGTYFPEIGDPGNTTRGLGMGHMGQERLDWAFKKFDEAVQQAEARAQNPTNKILSIKLSVFGFSRGAAAARAFVRDMALRCHQEHGQYRLERGNYAIEVMFLGLFDTVASVGLPMSANNTPGATSLGAYGTRTTVDIRARLATTGILAMAFGEPGADPAPGSFDGHAAWADGLQVTPGFVKRCVHMVAGHEMRNSFPLDSALFGRSYPDGVSEMVYPGAHSDVGGGYQPGEGARSLHPGEMLSLIPLRTMHAEARSAGVPLDSLESLRKDASVNKAFALDEEGAEKFAEMADLMTQYMQMVGSGGRAIGQELLAHSSWFLRWRFFNIRRNQHVGGRGPDAAAIARREPAFAAERRRMTAKVGRLAADWQRANTELDRAQRAYNSARAAQVRFGLPAKAGLKERVALTSEKERAARAAHLQEKAKLDTYADDSDLADNLSAYERRLVQDAEAIIAHRKRKSDLPLRPHYRNLIEAYEAQYLRRERLSDKLVAFFDRYVHDSLAGFAKDATLPSDPRVVYAGGDNKIRYAGLLGVRAADDALAA